MTTNFDIDNIGYQNQLTRHIKAILNESNKELSFHQIVTKSEGASPVSVKSVLDNLAIKYSFDKSAYIISQNTSLPTRQNHSILSDPHPADYDWRFDELTIEKYLQDLTIFSDKKIALLGIKTVFAGLIDKKIDTTIFNRSSSLLNDFKNSGYSNGLVECDLFYPQPNFNNSFNLAIADPPWYPEFYATFINRGADFLKMGGLFHISVLKKLTRPNAEKDREFIIATAEKVGLHLLEIIPDYFTYETPPFEKNTLKVQNLYCESWRKSDLFIFQKDDSIENQMESFNNSNDESWIEFRRYTKKVKIKKTRIQDDTFFKYESSDPDNIVFTNVSRRSPYRNRIDVWTSDNFAFRVYKLKVLVSYLENINLEKNHNEVLALLKEQYSLSEQEITNLTLLTEIIFNDSTN